jgi:1-acyl-sn-glycerol-3-phosphate acyltransferase
MRHHRTRAGSWGYHARVHLPSLSSLASRSLKLAGWEVETSIPDVARCVVLAAPHTSNWDGVLLLSIAPLVGHPLAWMIKDDWLRGPMGVVLRRLGAVGIDRSKHTNVVQAMIDELGRRDDLWLVIPPEGTRRRAEGWKSGFYHIARGARVPVVPGYLDYQRRRAGFGAPIELTGDVRADMDRIRAFYEERRPMGHSPDDFGPIRLREE